MVAGRQAQGRKVQENRKERGHGEAPRGRGAQHGEAAQNGRISGFAVVEPGS